MLFRKICACIPGRLNNRTMVNIFELMRNVQKARKKNFTENLQKNRIAFLQHGESMSAAGGFVEDQHNWADMAYGKSTMKYSGCEVFATFNALYSLTGKYPVSLPELIAEYEKDGMVFSGMFGTAPRAVADFFKRHGYQTAFTTDEKNFDQIGRENDSLILTVYNDRRDIFKEIHTVNISKEAGQYTAHNVTCDGKTTGPYNSVSEMIRHMSGGRARGISLIGLKKTKWTE